MEFPAKKVLGKHLEYPAASLIPWSGYDNGNSKFPQTLLIGCCDYLAWLGLEWVFSDGARSTSEPSTPLPGSAAESFEWDRVQEGLVSFDIPVVVEDSTSIR